jgi:hypothetical protein
MTSMSDDLATAFSKYISTKKIAPLEISSDNIAESTKAASSFETKQYTITGEYILALQSFHKNREFFEDMFKMLQDILDDDFITLLNGYSKQIDILKTGEELETEGQILYNVFYGFSEKIVLIKANDDFEIHCKELIAEGKIIEDSCNSFNYSINRLLAHYYFCQGCHLLNNPLSIEIELINDYVKDFDENPEIKERIILTITDELETLPNPPNYLKDLLHLLEN